MVGERQPGRVRSPGLAFVFFAPLFLLLLLADPFDQARLLLGQVAFRLLVGRFVGELQLGGSERSGDRGIELERVKREQGV